MSVEKDLSSNDIIPDGDWDISDLEVLESLKAVERKLDNIEKLLTENLQVNNSGSHKNKAGRKCLKMYYENKLIDDDYLVHLKDVMQLTVGQIQKDFFYIDDCGKVVTDKNNCKSMINNRLRKVRNRKQ